MKNWHLKLTRTFLKNKLYVKKESNTKATNAILAKDIDFKKELSLENDLERALLQDEEFIRGLHWGVPRYGHPEGQIYRHIREVFENIDKLELPTSTRSRLRLITLAHDTFKFKEDKGFPRNWQKHHGVLGRQYLEQFTKDKAILDITELPDQAYYSWRATHL